jgi:hypothetical protein
MHQQNSIANVRENQALPFLRLLLEDRTEDGTAELEIIRISNLDFGQLGSSGP